MNSIQTVTLNSALSQNWVGCTVRTLRTQAACTLRVQCPCRGRCCEHRRLVARILRAQPAQVARMLGVHLSRHAQAACPLGRDLTSMSRHQGSQHHVATSNRCRDIVSLPTPLPMSRHQNDVATSSLA